MTDRDGIYLGAEVFYRDPTRITICGIKSEWMRHHVSQNNIRQNDTGLTGTMH